MEIRKINSSLLLIIAILVPFNSILMNYLFTLGFFEPIQSATGYLIQSTLTANLISISVFSVLIFVIGKLDAASMFLTRSKVMVALKWVVLIWLMAQITSIVVSYITSGEVVMMSNLKILFGSILAQVFGNAAYEEMIFRGLFLVQLYLLFKNRMTNKRAMLTSIFASQMLFALIHIPNRLLINQVDNLVLDLLGLFIAGIIFALIYIRTENLALVIGIHALVNVPFNVTDPSFPIESIIIGLTIILAIFWKKLTRIESAQRWWQEDTQT